MMSQGFFLSSEPEAKSRDNGRSGFIGALMPKRPSAAVDDERPSYAGLIGAIDRLAEVVDQETAALRTRSPVDLTEFSTRKTHGHLELSRAMRPFEGAAIEPAVREKLLALRSKLQANRDVLAIHLEAVREISTVLADAIRETESDGTYSSSIGRPLRQ